MRGIDEDSGENMGLDEEGGPRVRDRGETKKEAAYKDTGLQRYRGMRLTRLQNSGKLVAIDI